MLKVSAKHDPETAWVWITQEENIGIRLHESDIFTLLRALRKTEHQNILYSGRFGVYLDKKSVILYDLLRGQRRTCVVLEKEQATRLAAALETSYKSIIESYSYNDFREYN